MAHYQEHPTDKTFQSKCVCIPSYENTVENVTLYHVRITIGEYYWVVKRRYSEFHELNEKLRSTHRIERFLLPPKKLFGSQSEQFIQKRKMELEQYLKTLFTLDGPPSLLRKFLDFNKYEIHGIIQTMAEELFYQGDNLLVSNEMYPVTPLQLYSLTMRLKMPLPTCDTGDKRKDIGHILDFLSQVHSLHICGCNKSIGSSNIIPNNLIFDLNPLKSLSLLKIDGCNPKMIQGLANVRKTVKKLQVQDSIKELKNLLLCDILHWDPDHPPAMSIWSATLHADFSYNQLTGIDNSIWLLSNVKTLDLSHNQISSIENLDRLSNLANLQLSFNYFSVLPPLHVHLGNIVSLNFAGNSIESLQAFSKLYSLTNLDVQFNHIQMMSEISHIACLPCLETLNLSRNPITMVVDYRTRVLEQFNTRAHELCLDNERPTQKELDTVAILQAIRRAKEGSISQVTSRNSSIVSENLSHRQATTTTQNVSNDKIPKLAKKSTSSAPNNLTEFRQQIEKIRAQGGTGWLRLWNLHQFENKNKPANNTDSEITNDTLQDDTVSEAVNSVTRHGKEHPVLPLILCDFVLPEDLPDMSNKAFYSLLGSHLMQQSSLAKNESHVSETDDSKSIPIDIKKPQMPTVFWTIVMYTHNKTDQMTFPACIAVTDVWITILVLRSIDFENGLKPRLVHFSKFQLGSLTNVQVGRNHHFAQLELSNESENHVYILKFPSKNLCASFVNTLQLINQQRNVSLQFLYLSLSVAEVTDDDADLLNGTINYSWVAVDTPIESGTQNCLTCIAIAKCHICLVLETLNVSESRKKKIWVAKKWNVLTDVTDLSFENPIKIDWSSSSAKANEDETMQPTEIHENLKNIICQSGFRIVLWLVDKTTLSIRYPSAESRDEFLEAFTQERNSFLTTNVS